MPEFYSDIMDLLVEKIEDLISLSCLREIANNIKKEMLDMNKIKLELYKNNN
jgi:hypothetical protein